MENLLSSQVHNMKFRRAYLITIILSFLGIFFVLFLNTKLAYFLNGYDSNVVNEYTAKSFQAVRETYPARMFGILIVYAITILCLILSCVAIYRRIYLSYYLTQISLIFSVLLSLFYTWLLIIAMVVPRGILG